jgi:phytoene dehydrogenase-like protein
MSVTADFIVAGGGHNSLITANYLQRAGYECVVLDAAPVAGGGASTAEILLPGYRFDTCSTGHTLIQVNPLLVDDELGLLERYGLEYLQPDPVAHVCFPDGESLTMWLDPERTIEETARFSREDAEAYRRLIAEYAEIAPVLNASRFTPPGQGPAIEEALRGAPRGSSWMRRQLLSAADVIRHEFSSPHVRAFHAWMAFQTAQPLDSPGSGMLAYSLVSGRQRRSWTIPRGGSGSLPEALVRALEDAGGTVATDRRVVSLIVEGGRCAGVETADGERYLAREGVVSTIHVKHLVEMAPAAAWGEDFLYGVDTYDIGIPAFVVYLASKAAPVFAGLSHGGRTAVSAGIVGWLEDVVRYGRDVRDGRFVTEVPWLLVATPTLVDPSRAPARRHTVKLLSMQTSDPPEGSEWELAKEEHADRQLEHVRRFVPGLTDEAIEARLVKSPLDLETMNPHMFRGTIHGGDRGIAQLGALRPVPGWGQHRMPIRGLYQTGATTHPGGSITGAPGRNAASVILQDLGTSIGEAVSRGRATTGRPAATTGRSS